MNPYMESDYDKVKGNRMITRKSDILNKFIPIVICVLGK